MVAAAGGAGSAGTAGAGAGSAGAFCASLGAGFIALGVSPADGSCLLQLTAKKSAAPAVTPNIAYLIFICLFLSFALWMVWFRRTAINTLPLGGVEHLPLAGKETANPPYSCP